MPDNKTLTTPADATRINIHEDYEVRYWCEKFGCTPEQLTAAVQKAGVMSADVQKLRPVGGELQSVFDRGGGSGMFAAIRK